MSKVKNEDIEGMKVLVGSVAVGAVDKFSDWQYERIRQGLLSRIAICIL